MIAGTDFPEVSTVEVRAGAPLPIRRLILSIAAVTVLFGCASTLSTEDLAAEYFALGTGYLELGRFEKSSEYLLRAVDLDPDLTAASYNLARAYAHQGRYADALRELEELSDLDPENVTVLTTLAYVQYNSGDPEAAAATYDAALSINPADVDLLYNRAVIHRDAGEDAAAGELLQRAATLAPDDADVVRALSRVLIVEGRFEAAAEQLERYVELVADDVEARLDLGAAYAALTDYSEALDVFAAVKELSQAEPGQQAEAAFARARILLTAAEEPGTGLEELQRALELGFADAEAAAALLERPDLRSGDDVRSALEEAGVLGPVPDDDAAADPTSEGMPGGDDPEVDPLPADGQEAAPPSE